ncbi:hypothetical protein CAPTEDRAFT_228238 [Capitella teleta]|uniref:Peptidase M14 domain-containing protein n=1 Tax=Capitella teleta TaxID=283909 RepID=R7UUP3_CAPTE|nr:hypothetical protein CAPTEDRAFT_228238 [Capitella teleta]|eukprot:ELU07081.1 hypothetical protein CAPTEDRAFT_228238 [Capitella teleta]
MVSMNPDGYNRSIEEVGLNGGACYGYVGRYNKNRVDLNRNFPDYFTPNQDKREPETVAVMDWIARNPFILCANLHGGALVANYPYDNYANANVLPNYSATKDDDVFRYLARKFSFSHQNMFLGVPCSSNEQGFPKGITNGAAWYPVGGGMQDFSYIVGNCMELTLEIGCCKFPHDDEIERNWIANKDALINYLMSVHMGVKGTVRDEETKRPIERALVSIENRDHPRFTTEHGEFWRLLLPKTYTLQVNGQEMCRWMTTLSFRSLQTNTMQWRWSSLWEVQLQPLKFG